MTFDDIMTGLVPGMTADRVRAAERVGITDFADQAFACRVVFGLEMVRESAVMRMAIAFRDGIDPPDLGQLFSPVEIATIRTLVAEIVKRDQRAKAQEEETP